MDLNFNSCKILIVGDVMLDKYYFGKVERISPASSSSDSKHRNRGITLGRSLKRGQQHHESRRAGHVMRGYRL